MGQTATGSISRHSDTDGNLSNFEDILLKISRDKLIDQTGIQEIDIHPYSNVDASIFDHWMSLVLLAGRKLKVCIKIHFDTESGKQMILSKFNRSPDSITLDMIFDRLKELSNLTAGGLKESLGQENGNCGLSLPLVTRGFDEVLFRDRFLSAKKHGKRNVWQLKSANFKLILSSEIQVFDWSAIQEVNYIERDEEEEGELEFL